MTTVKPNTIDQTTKVNLGILGTLLVSAVGGAAFMSSLKTSVDSMAQGLTEVKTAIDRNTHQIANDGREQAVMQATLAAQADTIRSLTKRVEVLENGK